MNSYLIVALLLILGILLLVAYSKIAKDIENLPSTSNVKKANQGLFTMGITFIVTSICFGICHHKCGSGLVSDSKVILGFLFLLGIVMMSLSAVIVGKVSGPAKSWATFLLVVGILFIVGIGALFAYSNKEKFGGMMAFDFY
jgi:hypothetical protein